jgi:soluble lytic murein transglycosylase-like protein
MMRTTIITAAMLAAATPAAAQDATRAKLDAMIASHAQENGVPVALVHRVIRRESGYRPGLVGKGGAMGLMQIKLATARGLGYTGTAQGLLDPETNLTYAVRYLAGAYRVAGGNDTRAVSHYAHGYYYAAKHKGMLAAIKAASASTTVAVAAAEEGAAAAEERPTAADAAAAPTPAPADAYMALQNCNW